MSGPKSPQPFGGVVVDVTYVGATGVRFNPSDQELIVAYLQRKLRGEPLLIDAVNDDDDDVYSEHPKNLVGKLRKGFEGTWYLFSPRSRKYGRGERPRRSSDDGVGFWKSMGAKLKVPSVPGGKEVIGYKCSLTFHVFVDTPGLEPGRPKQKRPSKPTEWKMVEFVSINSDRPPNETAPNPMLLNDYVLCKIVNKKLLHVTGPDLSQRQSIEEEEQEEEEEDEEEEEQEPSDSTGASQEQQREEPQDKQQDATSPNGEDTAAAAAAPFQEAGPEDFDPGANVLDDEQWSDSEPLKLADYLDTNNMPGIFDLDDNVETADVAGESQDDKQQTTSVGSAGSPDEQQQATPEASTNKAATAAGDTAAAPPITVAVPNDYDWEGWENLDTEEFFDIGFNFRRMH